ncbi:unnamed protein product [Allacma fusca]|uniref:Uncharacterized protein n=1 Tax=Allacma fusca TaxID=39272 RepID=A0A8J2KZW3_9HEXA|nr:unnamed protein product [Allacma fusca]
MAKFFFVQILFLILYSKAIHGVADNEEIRSEPARAIDNRPGHFWPEVMEFFKGVQALSNLQNNLQKFESNLLTCSSSNTNSQVHENNDVPKEYSGRMGKILNDAQEINNKNFQMIFETLFSMNATLTAIISEGFAKAQIKTQSCSNLPSNLQQIETTTVTDDEISKQDQQWIENMLKDPEAKLFTRTNFKGEFEEYSLETTLENGGCYNLMKFPTQIKSIETFGKCVRDPKGIRQNVTKPPTDVRTYFPDLCEFSSYEQFNNSTQTRDAGSINRILLGPKSRIEYTRAYIYSKHLNDIEPGVTEEEIEILKSLDKHDGDSLGFAIPLNLGGVLKNFNVFPQSESNKAEWAELLSSVASYLGNLGSNQVSGRSKSIDNMLKNPKAKLFARTNFKGEFEEYSLKTMPENGGCVNFNKLIKTIKSVDTFGKCVRVFANRSCMGWSLAVYPGSGNSHGILSFKFTQIQSIGPCVQNEFKFAYFQDSKGIRENITKNSTDVKTYFPDLCAFSSVEKYRDSKQPPDNGSISWISLGPKNRVEYIRAHIYLKHLTANVPDGSEEEGKIFKSLDKQVGDSLGFVIPLSMGGVLKNFNVFPQSQANRAEWGELTFNLTSDLKRLSNNQGSDKIDLCILPIACLGKFIYKFHTKVGKFSQTPSV